MDVARSQMFTVDCLQSTSSRCEICMLSVSNMIYHKFSHGAAFYTLNVKNVNIILECPSYRPVNGLLNDQCPC